MAHMAPPLAAPHPHPHPPSQASPGDGYRISPHEVYHGGPTDPYRQTPPGHMAFNQPAPRQRTAIACRYCRRRKIRCSGFESSEDGRCSNCQRFNQECIFTPVSSQAQAFVPAHTAYPHLRNPVMSGRGGGGGAISPGGGGRGVYGHSPPVIYGAHGQPLNAYPAEGGGYAQPPDHSPTEGDPTGGRRREHEPHTPTLPPVVGGAGRLSARRGSSTEYQYHDSHRTPGSPASSTASYQTSYSHSQHPPHPSSSGAPSGYWVDPRQTPPQHFPLDRRSSSPRDGSASGHAGGYSYGGGLHPPMALPPRAVADVTPPPQPHHHPPPPGSSSGPRGSSDDRRAGMSIQNLLDQSGSGGRSARDNEMLDALNRRRI
ncbi:MAG: hypothetical protein M1823_000707 [Watsoniomyces obsoletus]|nr:MAG: hypothetical protein M1823_000707 [Watsoniomyces obsoletus]